MIEWIQSTALFRAWAEDWVLWPSDEDVFRLPIANHYLHVRVSPTLGLVSHCVLTHLRVCGCVGHNRILVESSENPWRVKSIHMEEVCCETMPNRGTIVSLEGGSYFSPLCNRKWIIGFPASTEQACIWKIVGGALSEEPGRLLAETRLEWFLHFSPLCDDVVIVSSYDIAIWGYVVLLCDVQASFDQGKLVVISKLRCSYVDKMMMERLEGVVWRPDGSICTLHNDSHYHRVLVDVTTEEQVARFPGNAFVTPVGRNHLFVRAHRGYSKFKVYNTSGRKLTTTPCTWASPAMQSHSGLIAHSGPVSGSETATQVTFTVCDVGTGFCVCHIPVTFDSRTAPFDSDSYYLE